MASELAKVNKSGDIFSEDQFGVHNSLVFG